MKQKNKAVVGSSNVSGDNINEILIDAIVAYIRARKDGGPDLNGIADRKIRNAYAVWLELGISETKLSIKHNPYQEDQAGLKKQLADLQEELHNILNNESEVQ